MRKERVPNVLMFYKDKQIKIVSMESDSFLNRGYSCYSVFAAVDECINLQKSVTVKELSFFKVVNIHELPDEAKRKIVDEDQEYVNFLCNSRNLECFNYDPK